MIRARPILVLLPKILAPTALAVWFGFIYLTLQYDATRPVVRQPDQGRVYSLSNHGHVVFLTANERRKLDELQLLALGLFLSAFFMDFSLREREYVRNIRAQIMEKTYALASGAGWYALGRTLQEKLASIGQRRGGLLGLHPPRIDIRTDDPIGECRDRLARDVYLNPMHVTGSFDGKKVHLWVVRENFQNSFKPHFYGVLYTRAAQTRLTGQFGMHLIARIFLVAWFAVLAVVEMLILAGYTSSLDASPRFPQYPALFFPLGLMLCGALIVHWANRLAKDDQAHITLFLERSMRSHNEQYL